MTPEQSLFFQILSDHMEGRSSVLDPAALDRDRFYDLVRRQNLCGLFYVQCRDMLPPEDPLRQKLYQGFCADIFHWVNRNQALEEMLAAHQAAGISLYPMKGAAVSALYPVPALRTMGDMDLLLRREDRETSDRIMRDLGYQVEANLEAVWNYQRGPVLFELHDHMIYHPLFNDLDYQTYFDGVWDHIENGVIQPEFHFLFLVAHAAKHIFNKGYGVRGFLDLVFFTRGHAELDWGWITGELERLRLLDFTNIAFALCRRWFQVEMPLSDVPLQEDFVREATEKMFLDGLFGFDNAANEISGSAKTIHRAKGPYWLTACRMTLGKLFPPYRIMRDIPWYGFVDGRPWLLPAAWVYRWGYCLLRKRDHGKRTLQEPFARSEEIQARDQWFRSWGL